MPSIPKYKLEPIDRENSIGERICLIRKKRGLTQKNLADEIGIPRYLISGYERGRLRLYDEMVARFAMALNVSADKILGLKEEEHDIHKPDLRITKRLRQISELTANNQKALLKTIDNYLRGAKENN